jgi:hypothetical protein
MNRIERCNDIQQKDTKGAFTLARFSTKLARLLMKKKYFFSKTCKLNAKSHAKFTNVNAP